LILSIESSCDDSAIALSKIDDYKVIFHKKISQMTHSSYGGVVPEIAAREHAKALPLILEEIKDRLNDIKAIAVTHTPGLSITLLEGVMMAKSLSVALNLPLIGVNHLYAHMYSLFIEKKVILPQVVLLISGGHSALFELKEYNNINLIGSSLDDSVGESFDKVAKMLSLGYPGGHLVENLAKNADEQRYNFPIALKHKKEIAFSYSGLKNAVRLQIQESIKNNTLEEDKANICASFQYVATEHLINKVSLYLQNSDIANFAIVGGVSSNKYIRGKFEKLCKKFNKTLYLAQPQYCSDNAAMVGRYAIEMFHNKQFVHHSKLEVKSRYL
jgi:N6-L-threonylcarbamoyladenine synthase